MNQYCIWSFTGRVLLFFCFFFARDCTWFLWVVTPFLQSNIATIIGRRNYFLSLLLFFHLCWKCWKVMGSHISEWGVLILLELETLWLWESGTTATELGLDLVEVVSPGLLILLEHLQKLHISATRQQKAPRGFLCSFIAGGGKEIKGFGSISLTVWCNFVQCTEENLVYSVD